MKIWKEILYRLLFALISLAASIVMSFSFIFFWLVIKGFILGYGDSGPDWVNVVTKGIKIASIAICLVLSQLVFNRAKKRGLE